MALTRLLTSSVSERPSLKKIEWMCFSTARLLSTSDVGDCAVALPLSDLGEDLALPRSQSRQGRALGASLRRDEQVHDPRVHDRATVCDGLEGGEELFAVAHALLEQVSAAVRARLEQGQRVARLGVLAEHHHANARVGLPQERREPDPLVAVGRGHPDVRQHHVRWIGLDCLEQRREVCVRAHELDVLLSGEHLLEALSHEQIVVRDHDADGHERTITRGPCAIAVDAPPCERRRTPRRTPAGVIAGPVSADEDGVPRHWHPNRHKKHTRWRHEARTVVAALGTASTGRRRGDDGRRPGRVPSGRTGGDRGDRRLRALGRGRLRGGGARARGGARSRPRAGRRPHARDRRIRDSAPPQRRTSCFHRRAYLDRVPRGASVARTSCSARRRSSARRTSGPRCSDGCGSTTADVRSALKGSTRSQPLRRSERSARRDQLVAWRGRRRGMFARTVVPRPGVDSTTRVPPSAPIRSDMFASP